VDATSPPRRSRRWRFVRPTGLQDRRRETKSKDQNGYTTPIRIAPITGVQPRSRYEERSSGSTCSQPEVGRRFWRQSGTRHAADATRHFTILTCMDARLDPAKFAGLAEGDGHVIRNAGGRASDDAIRSLAAQVKDAYTLPASCSNRRQC